MSFRIALILLLYLGAAGGAAGAEEAAGLRASASARIDAFTEHFRKTGDRQSRVPDLRTAVDELSRAHRDSAARSDAAGAAESLVRLGQIQRLVGNWKEALRLYEQALPLIQRAGDPGLLARARTGMALAAMSLSDFGAAATHAADAVFATERSTDARTRFDALDVLGQVQAARFDLNAAADTLDRALDVARKADNEKLLSFGYMDRAEVWLKRAEKCDFQRTFGPCRQALAQARADYAESRRLLTRLGYEGLGRVVDRFLAEVRQREQLVGAMESYDKTIRSAGMFEPSAPGDVLVTERYVNSGGQVPPVVQDFYGRMKAAQAEAGSFGDSTAARARYVEGLMAEMGGRQDEALAQYLNAVALLERDRGRLAGDKERGSFLEDKTGFYTAAVLQLLERRRHAEAFELMERLRARGMADLLASRSLGLAQGSERSLFGESVRLKSEIAARQSQLLDLAIGGNAVAPSRAKALGAEIAKLEDELAALDARIAREAPRLRQLTVAEPVVLAQLQQTMREEGFEMLQYLVLEHAVILWHISHDAVNVRNVFLPRSVLQEKAARMRKSLTDPNVAFDTRAARQLYLFLVQPAKAWLKARRVVIVPHDDLYHVPFQVLMDPDGRVFGEAQTIAYVPSATVLMSLKRPAAGPAGALFAAADPDLPAAPDEVKAVAKLYPDARVITDRLARKGEVRAALKGRDVVHLSVHGKFDAAEPLLSHLVFAAGDGDDGRFTAAEMFGLPLERARLVVLSACETGRSRADNAGDVQGMLRALLYAGAGGVVLSYWAVDSDATAAWMGAFHRAARDKHPAEAARSALVAVKSRKEYAHPYYWAAFMTVGR